MKSFCLIALFSCLAVSSIGQTNDDPETPRNTGEIFDLRLGYHVGAILTFPEFNRSNSGLANAYFADSLSGISSRSELGSFVGIQAEYMLANRLVMEIQPALVFSGYTLVYDLKGDGPDEESKIELTTIKVPVYVNYRMSNWNWKPVIGAGVGYHHELAAGAGRNQGHWSAELAFGLEKWVGKFAIEPEVRYGIGLSNTWEEGATLQSSTIGSMELNTLSFVLNFKG